MFSQVITKLKSAVLDVPYEITTETKDSSTNKAFIEIIK